MKRKGFLIGQAFNKYLWASVLTVAATQIANMVDASLVGNLVGAEGLAAVTISKPVLQAIYALSSLFVVSSTMLTGMAMGRGEQAKARALFTSSLLVAVVLGLLIAVVGCLCQGGLSALLCQSDSLRPLADSFMLVTLLSALPQLVMLTLQQFVTIDDSPRLVTLSVIIGNLFNVGLDILFMKYFGWGIAGAAWATFAMYVICIAIVLLHFRRPGSLRLDFASVKSQVSVGEVLQLGLPFFLSTALMSVQLAGSNSIATTYLGDHGLVALAVCLQFLSFSMIILTGTLRTIQPVGSILRGIGDTQGILMLMGRAYRFMGICLALFVALLVLCPAQVAALMGVSGTDALPFIMAALPAYSMHIVMEALLSALLPVYQFYGHHRLAMTLSVSRTLLPVVGFWLFAYGASQGIVANAWWGFFAGQLVVALLIVVCTEVLRRRDRLMPLLLLPRTDYPTLELSYDYSPEQMHRAFDELSAWLKGQQLPESTIFRVRIIAEELMSNITRHSEQHNARAYADVRLMVAPDAVTFALTDDGSPFNPIENRDLGYGLMIANGAASKIDYKYQFGQNMTTVKVYRNI